MVGNDVVDLADVDADASTYSPRFDARAFDADERAWMAASADPDRARWVLWAAKEAAYKALKRAHRGTVFSPSTLEVRLESSTSGPEGERWRGGVTVGEGPNAGRIAEERLRVEVEADAERVHAVAWREGELAPSWEIAPLPQPAPTSAVDPSSYVRRRLVRKLAAALGVPRARLAIERRGRLAAVQLVGRDASIDVSLTHHGRFVACAWSPRDVRRARSLVRPAPRRTREVCA